MKSIDSNPGKCPECGNELTNKNWRSHLKNRHMYSYNSYMYAHTQINSKRDNLYPPQLREKGKFVKPITKENNPL